MALTVLAAITALFGLLLVFKGLLKREFCVLCASVSVTWLLLLALYALGYISEVIFIAVLVGESVTGVFYLVERRVKKRMKLFRLPFLLTLTLGAFALFVPVRELWSAILFLVAVWVVLLVVYVLRNKRVVGNMVKKIIACCKNW